MHQEKLPKLLKYLDQFGLTFLAVFLIIFIPLYPKVPLLEAIPGYLVKIRLEDILILITGAGWLIQMWRGKIHWFNSLIVLILVYALVGITSLLSGMFLIQTIPLEPLHIGKSVLHYFRYLEYFSLFVIVFSSITSLKQAKALIGILSGAVAIIIFYAIGQLRWAWPVFSTMNREYSKGAALTLGADARVQSTFAGHYDLSAFLVLILPYFLVAALSHPRWIYKSWLAAIWLGAFWLLIETGSKFSLFAGLISVAITALLYLRRYPRVWKVAMGSCLMVVATGSLIIGYSWFKPQDPRLLSTLQAIEATPVGQISLISKVMSKVETVLIQRQVSSNTVSPETISLIPEECTPTPPDQSENTKKYGLSLGIRLDVLWPQALHGLARNLLVGSGYGTLNKTGTSMFVEADSTDNNLLRTLGETGILGFITFYAVGWFAVRSVWKYISNADWLIQTVSLGLVGASIGILLNALMIDVFVASKVAFTFWALVGLSLKTVWLRYPLEVSKQDRARLRGWYEALKTHWPVMVASVILVLIVHRNPLIQTGQIATFSADRSATTAITTITCWLNHQEWSLCLPNTSQPSATSYVYGLYLLLWYAVWNFVGLYYYANLLLGLILLISTYFAARLVFTDKASQFGWLLIQSFGLFYSNVVVTPREPLLAAVLTTMICYLLLSWPRTRSGQIGMKASVVILLWLEVVRGLHNWDWLIVFSPIISLLIVRGIRYMAKHQYFAPPGIRRGAFASFVGSLILLQSTPALLGQWLQLKNEYQSQTTDWDVQSVRVLNDIFSGQQGTQTGQGQPVVLTAANPYFVQLYAKYPYQVSPLIPLITQNGLAEFSPVEAVRGWLDARRDVYITNSNLVTTSELQAFQSVRNAYNIDLLSEGCDNNCNIYQVLDYETVYSQPVLTDLDSYSVIIFNQHFDVSLPASLRVLQSQIAELSKQSGTVPDLLIVQGTKVAQLTVQLPASGATGKSSVPVFVVPQSSPSVTEEFISWRTPHDVFIMINAAPNGSVGHAQQLKILNALIDIEQDPAVKNIVILSDRLVWLTEGTNYQGLADATERTQAGESDRFFREELLPKLQKLADKKIFVVAGDMGRVPLDMPALYYEQTPSDQVTYLATAVRYRPNDMYVQYSVASDGLATIRPISRTNQPLAELDQYGKSLWSTEDTSVPLVESRLIPWSQLRARQSIAILAVVTTLLLWAGSWSWAVSHR